MRVPRLLIVAAIAGALAAGSRPAAAADAAAGDMPFRPAVGITRDQFLALLSHSDMKIMSDIGGVVAVESHDPDIEFERYAFTLPAGEQPGRLWQITYGYRMPADPARFARAEAALVGRFGRPAQSTSRAAEHDEPPFERRVWESGDAVVTLAGYPDGQTTGEAERMQATIVDRRLQRFGLAQRRGGRPRKH